MHDFLMWSELVATIINVNSGKRERVVRGEDIDPFRASKRKSVGVDILRDVFVRSGTKHASSEATTTHRTGSDIQPVVRGA